MDLGSGQMAALLQDLHQGVAAASLDARMKYFQRRGFPSGEVAVGKGWRAEYGPTDMMKLVIAFELLDSFVPPAQASALVAASWAGVREALAEAWVSRRDRQFALPIILKSEGFGSKTRDVGSLDPCTADDIRAWLQGAGSRRAVVVMDALRIVKAFDTALASVLPEPKVDRMRAAFDEWAAGTE